MSFRVSLSVVTVAISLPVAALSDDRPPNAEERSRIEATLSSAGYTYWEEIEFDEGFWEVDDARKEGSPWEFDLKLDPQSFAITSVREDF